MDCSRVIIKTDHVVGSVLPEQTISWETMARELTSLMPRGFKVNPGEHIRITTDLVQVTRTGAVALLPLEQEPNPLLPSTLRHVPWVKLRIAACGDRSNLPVWMDLGQSVVLPWHCVAAALVVPSESTFQIARDPDEPIPPDNVEHETIDAWISVKLEPTCCCEPRCVTLTDSVLVGVNTDVVIPPRARTLTIHKSAGAPLAVEWMASDQNAVGTSGMPAEATQLVLTVPDVPHLRLNGDGIVLLVWGLLV